MPFLAYYAISSHLLSPFIFHLNYPFFMQKLVYYVAMSLDGYIAGDNDDVSGFLYSGKAVEKYLEDLKSFETVIMGKSTYEFGYKFGATPGEPSPAYPHMKHYIVSENLAFDNPSPLVNVVQASDVLKVKQDATSPIYLCGGGKLAGGLLKLKLIDEVKVKLNPVIFGSGVKLFEGISTYYHLSLIDSISYEDGMVVLTYQVNY